MTDVTTRPDKNHCQEVKVSDVMTKAGGDPFFCYAVPGTSYTPGRPSLGFLSVIPLAVALRGATSGLFQMIGSQFYLTGTVFCATIFLASSFLGSRTFNTPSLYCASMASAFTSPGRVKLRENEE